MDSPAAELLQAARRNEPDAWNTLLRQHQLPLYTYAAELLRDEAGAFDIVQETFASAFRYIDSLRDDRRFASWLFGIAHQKCVQRWRQRQRDEAVFDLTSEPNGDWLDTQMPDPRTVLLQQEQADAFFAVLDELPGPQRATLLLHVIEDFSLQDIAQITGVAVGTVKSRLFHAKRTLRAIMEAKA